MTTVAASKPAPWARLSWIVLVLAWIALLLPSLRVVAGVPLAVIGLVLALLAARASRRTGLPPLVAAVLVSPLLYFMAAPGGAIAPRLLGEESTTDATSPADAAPTPATSAPAPASTVGSPRLEDSARAFMTSITAVELASAYAYDRAEADRLYRDKGLLLTGMVADTGRDGSALTLAANDYPPVRAQGLKPEVVAALRPEQQITLACRGAGATGNAAEVVDCSMQ